MVKKNRQIAPFLSTQNVNVARFARIVEWDFFCDFQTMWSVEVWYHKMYLDTL